MSVHLLDRLFSKTIMATCRFLILLCFMFDLVSSYPIDYKNQRVDHPNNRRLNRAPAVVETVLGFGGMSKLLYETITKIL